MAGRKEGNPEPEPISLDTSSCSLGIMILLLCSATTISALRSGPEVLPRRGVLAAAAASLVATPSTEASEEKQCAYRMECDSKDKECLSAKRSIARENILSAFSQCQDDEPKIDWAGHSSFWGMAPPKLQGTWVSAQRLQRMVVDHVSVACVLI